MKNHSCVTVVGCGHWGKNLVRNFSELGQLSSIVEENVTNSRKLSEEFEVPVTTFESVLTNDSIKGVVIALPAALHAQYTIQALEAGKHVFVEKPLAISIQEANRMISAVQKSNGELMIGHLLQYHNAFIKLRELALSGAIGELAYINSNRLSFGKIRQEEDVVWSFAPHDLSMILSITNTPPTNVNCIGAKSIGAPPSDTAHIHLDFGNGLKAHVHVSWISPFKEQKFVVIGTKGMLVFDDLMPWDKKLSLTDASFRNNEGTIDAHKSQHKYIDVLEKEPLKAECEHFIDVLLGKHKPRTDCYEGLAVLEVLQEASRLA